MHKGVPLQHGGDKKSAKEVQYLIRSRQGGDGPVAILSNQHVQIIQLCHPRVTLQAFKS